MREDITPFPNNTAYPEKIRITCDENEICHLYAPYNPEKYARANALRGSFNKLTKIWSFPYDVDEEAVRELADDVYYTDGSETPETTTVLVEIEAMTHTRRVLFLCGREIAWIFENKHGTHIKERVELIEGGFDEDWSGDRPKLVVCPGTVLKILVLKRAAKALLANRPPFVVWAKDLNEDGNDLRTEIRKLTARIEKLEDALKIDKSLRATTSRVRPVQ